MSGLLAALWKIVSISSPSGQEGIANGCDITAAMVKTFENNVRHLAQQKESRLRAWVQEKDKTSSVHSFKRIGQQSLAAKVGRRVATPVNDSVWSNRVATPGSFDGGDTVESKMPLR
jgi:hypothetical protein